MKNIKIGAKILIGFGSVIALLVVVTIVVLVANLGSISNVTNAQIDSVLQTYTNDLRVHFLNARVPANLMIYNNDTELYQTMSGYVADMHTDLDSIYKFISENPILEKFREPVQKAEQAINDWASETENLNNCNTEQTKYNGELLAQGAGLAEVTTLLASGQSQLLEDDARRGASSDELIKRAERIEVAENVTSAIYSFRINARYMAGTYDGSQIDGILADMDKAVAYVEQYQALVTDQTQQNNVKIVLDTLASYRESVTKFADACNRATVSAELMPQYNEKAQELIDDVLGSIETAMSNQINNTVTAATSTLVIVMVIAAFSIVCAVIIARIIMVGITGPVGKMYKVINKVGKTGSFDFTPAEVSELKAAITKDEIGQSIEAFAGMMDNLIEIAQNLQTVANGDLSVSVKSVSADDTMANALNHMLDSLNEMFGSINEASDQVNSGASQVSSASQSLAQGATEQASSIEELSASIQQISSQVKENSDNADNANEIANETSDEVKVGNTQMHQMLEAMNDINSSSNEISKIIKVIDDIAFQTNILALNAAVEAARAGEAGKGFAVVADEVRNLASKSADAAKQTTGLIEGSIQSVARGAEIAQKTAHSLELVEQKTIEVNNLIEQIAAASKEQAQGITQINIGVEQISSVIQTNSATAEESAAAAEELSSQSNMLSDQISRFKLR